MGLFGIHLMNGETLLIFSLLNLLSIVVDVIRISLWSSYISNNLLNGPQIIGTYYLVLTVFGTIIKLVGSIFGFLLRREINKQNNGSRINVGEEEEEEEQQVSESKFIFKTRNKGKSSYFREKEKGGEEEGEEEEEEVEVSEEQLSKSFLESRNISSSYQSFSTK